MLIKQRKGWEIAESRVTPEHIFLNRRAFMGTAAGAAVALSAGVARAEDDPSAGLYPAKLNAAFGDAGRAVTPLEINRTYNNYYEFGTSKQIYEAAEALPIRPWSVVIDGEVDAPQTLAIDHLLKKVQLEERIYRHRCVEAWSMVVPWTGFTLKSLVELAKPKAEAMNDLSFLVTGAYGKPLPKSMGSPIRLHLPWKYGFKSIKGIVKISFVAERPIGMWEAIQSSEYGFWANVNPEVSHPRWSQAMEEVLGTGERVPTQLFNGYGDFVASLYSGLEKEPLYM